MMPDLDQIGRFLGERFGPVDDLTVLQGGSWSSAYAFAAGERELLLRVGNHREDFEKERIAATWHQPGLAVPEVLELGDAFDCHYVVSQRHHGTKLADLDPARVPAAIEALFDVLGASRHVNLAGTGFGIWHAPGCDAPATSWSEYLCGLADRDESRLVDWRRKLALHPRANTAFRDGCRALEVAAGDLPPTRGLVHADLLLNHLVGADDTITAVFDWGNALAGDPLYDVAWITFCIPWFPAIDRRHVLDLARRHFPDDDIDRLIPVYELHIAVAELPSMAFADDRPALEHTTDWIARHLSDGESS